ncbi:DUF935 domain-containing protein [Breoghania sp.]|uniref:DUF935 domain-containing protein n=1 Tax=Breoghania sp. TaxID=2065378 RepID=UPI0029CA7AD5|nr:DUF935 domain-containing protein [Breoghania sp.]
MADYQLVDPHGRPISSRQLLEEEAVPTVTGVRSAWGETIASGLDPYRLSRILRDAANNETRDFLTLAEEMEERDLHYGSVLGTRKRAVTGIEPVVNAASDEDRDIEIAEAVREHVVEAPEFVDMLDDSLDALGKGYSAVETLWDRGDMWRPRGYAWRDPRFFQFDRVSGQEVRLREEGSIDGKPLSPYSFIVHRPKLKSGLSIRGGLARLAVWGFVLKAFTLKDWAAFLEVFGMPLRVGKYGKSAGPKEKQVLLRAVRDLGTDAAAIIPTGMEIEFIEAKGGSGNAVFGAMAEYLDAQISKGVLGQTMTTDNGSSLAQAQVHENVRFDILRADARQLSATINRDLIRPFVAFNFGPQERYPTFDIPVTEAEDVKTLVDALDKLIPMGMEIGMADVRERIGFAAPDEGAAILRAPGKAEAVPPQPPEKEAPAQAARARRCPSCGGYHALAAVDPGSELDALIEDALADWQADMEPFLKPVRFLFARATSFDDLKTGLEALAASQDTGPLAATLADLLMKARGLGDIGDG